MSIWGKLLGGAAGFAIGGPIGALIGALAGHAVDRMSAETAAPPRGEDEREATRQVAFTIAVIALGAKMAKADGVVTRDEIAAFREMFRVPPEEVKNVARVFDIAKRDARGFEPYARQIAGMFSPRSPVLEELLDCLFHIAKADGKVTPDELEYLERVADIFGFDETAFARIRAEQLGPDKADPYTVLGVTRDMSDEEIKRAYRRLIRENHPDRLVAEGMPPELIAQANEKMANINAAYDRIAKERGL